MEKNNNTFLGTDIQKYLKIMLKVLILCFIALGFFIAYKVMIFFLPFLIAWIISLIIEPLIKFFTKAFKFKRKTSCIISFILILVIIGSLLFLLISKFTFELTNLVINFNDEYSYLSTNIKNFVNDFSIGLSLPDNINSLIQTSLESVFESSKTWIFSFFSNLAKSLTSLPDFITAFIITVLATVFICIDKEFVKKEFENQIPTVWLNKVKSFMQDMGSVSINYIKAQAKLSLMCFIFVLVTLLIVQFAGLNINYLITMCIAIGFIDVLPLFGAGTVMVPWAIYAYCTGNMPLAIVLIVLWIIWTIIRKIIEPKILSSEIGLHPIFTLLGMYAGYKLSGVVGLILGPIVLLVLQNAFSELLEKGILKSFFELD